MKALKSTAFILAAAVTLTTLTSCQGNYADASVTQVTNKSFTADDRKGTYTGYWRGDRPEGYGELTISENEYYKGEWVHGVLYGQGEIRKVSDDGIWKHYKGECTSNSPSGEGQLLIGFDSESYLIEVDGDFGNESTLLYFVTDEKGKLIDLGGMYNGGFVNYLDGDADIPWIDYSEDEKIYQENLEEYAASQAEKDTAGYLGTDEYEARYAERYAEIYDEFYSDHIKLHKDEEVYGKYIGQVDENGIPNGYGYYETYTTYNDIAVGSVFLSKIGTWKDGHIEGYYTELQSIESRNLRKDGCIKDGKEVGDFVSYESQTFSDGFKRDTVIKMNMDEINSYQLCEDGMYRTGTKITECFNSDGTKSHQEVSYRKDSSASGYITYLGEPCIIEGFYCVYDENGEQIDEGKPANGGTTEGWESLTPNDEDIWETIRIVAPILLGASIGVFIMSKIDFSWENSESKKWVDKLHENCMIETEEYFAHQAKRRELLDEARQTRQEAVGKKGYTLNNLLDKAEKLEREAESHYRSVI